MNLETIQVVVFDGLPVNKHLRNWVRRFPNYIYASEIADKGLPDLIGMWRNRVCYWFLKETELEYLLMIDADMVPIKETIEIVRGEAPLAGCRYIAKDGEDIHREDGRIGCGCMRIRRDVLETVQRPWFAYKQNDDGLEVSRCECERFCDNAREAGIFPLKRGAIGHVMPAVVSPKADGETAQIQLLSRWNKE